MFKFREDVIALLKQNGYTTYRIRKESLIGERTMKEMKRGTVPGIKILETLCRILNMQPGDLIVYDPNDADNNEA